jgi:hypothetical protein
MWNLYDRLIESVPSDIPVDEIASGERCTVVRAGGRIGASAVNQLESRERLMPEESLSRKLISRNLTWQQTAALIKSWNFKEASIGAAALNAFYNNMEQMGQIRQETVHNKRAGFLYSCDTFKAHQEEIRGKKVATIGHFHYAEEYLKEAGQLHILEREPRAGDYPDSACEYILPDMDYIFITGFTLVNKTLPRLLQLSRHGKVILTGPSVPMASQLFEMGVWELAGTVITDGETIRHMLKAKERSPLARAGQPVRLGFL